MQPQCVDFKEIACKLVFFPKEEKNCYFIEIDLVLFVFQTQFSLENI